MKRRELLQKLVITGTVLAPTAAISTGSESDRLGPVLPRRTLGKCGEKVTCLGLGGFHVGMPDDEAVAQAVIEKALESGIRFFDTAESYGGGRSEERYGKYLIPNYRDDVYVMTKSTATTAETAREHLEGSMRRMNIDVIDLWQIHSLKSPKDAGQRMENGLLEVALKAQQEGKVRHIGFTGHASPYAHTRMLEHEKVRAVCTACQFPINPVDAASRHSFVKNVLPPMLDNNIGIIAMKTLADGRFFARKEVKGNVKWTSDHPVIPNVLSIEECILYALSLPVSVLVTGAEKPEYVEDKVAIVRKFSGMSAEQRMDLVEKVVSFADQGEVEYYKQKWLREPVRKKEEPTS